MQFFAAPSSFQNENIFDKTSLLKDPESIFFLKAKKKTYLLVYETKSHNYIYTSLFPLFGVHVKVKYPEIN
jgi:hypothetical protein